MILVPLLFAGAVAAYLLTFYDVDLNLADEGFHLTDALSIERGDLSEQGIDRLLKRQVGIVYHLWFQLTGHRDLGTARLLWVLLRVFLGLMALAVARRLMPWPLALVAAALVVIAAGPWHKTWYPFSFGVMLYIGALRWEYQHRALAAGLVGGMLLMFHPVGVGGSLVLPTFAFLVIEPLVSKSGGRIVALRTALTLALSAAAGILLLSTLNAVMIVLTRGADPGLIWRGPVSALQLASPAYLASVLRYTSGWLAQGHLPPSALFQHGGGSVLGVLPGLVFLLQPVVLVLTIWILRSERRSERPDDRGSQGRLLALLIVLNAVGFVKTCARADLFHVMHAAGPSYLLMVTLLWRGGAALRRGWRRAGAAVRIGATAGLLSACALFPLGYTAAVLLSPGQWAASVGSLAEAGRRLGLERGGVRLSRARAEQLEAVVERVQAWTDPEDPIFTMPFCPGLYFLSDRLCVADDAIFPRGLLAVVPGLGLSRPRADEHLAHLLEARKVKVVVLCQGTNGQIHGVRQPWDSIPKTRTLLRRRYERAYEREGMVILRRRARQR